MKIYCVTDTYRGKRKYFGTEGQANFQASLLASDLETSLSNTVNRLQSDDEFGRVAQGLNPDVNAEDWIEVDCIEGKDALINHLNAKADWI